MREAVPGRLWVGNADDARDAAGLYRTNIQVIVDLAFEEPPAQLPRDFLYCRFPVMDGAGTLPDVLEMAVSTVAKLLKTDLRCLVSCSAGMSRSPAVVACAWARNTERSPEECLLEITCGQPHDVSPVLWSELLNVITQNKATSK